MTAHPIDIHPETLAEASAHWRKVATLTDDISTKVAALCTAELLGRAGREIERLRTETRNLKECSP